jgi:hypothetical protein
VHGTRALAIRAKQGVGGRLRALAHASLIVPLLTAALAAPVGAEATQSRPRTAPRCKTAALSIHLREFSGSNTEFAEKIEFKNVSHHRCTLNGHPRVVAIDSKGRQLGAPAASSPENSKRITLRPGRTAAALLTVVRVETESSSGECKPIEAAALRIYPPGATMAKGVSWRGEVCLNPIFHPGLLESVMTVGVVGSVA